MDQNLNSKEKEESSKKTEISNANEPQKDVQGFTSTETSNDLNNPQVKGSKSSDSSNREVNDKGKQYPKKTREGNYQQSSETNRGDNKKVNSDVEDQAYKNIKDDILKNDVEEVGIVLPSDIKSYTDCISFMINAYGGQIISRSGISHINFSFAGKSHGVFVNIKQQLKKRIYTFTLTGPGGKETSSFYHFNVALLEALQKNDNN